MWWVAALLIILTACSSGASEPPDVEPVGGYTAGWAYNAIVGHDQLYRFAGRDPDSRRRAEQDMTTLIKRIERLPGVTDPYVNNPLRTCLRAAIMVRESRRLEWERIISPVPDDGLIAAGRAVGDIARDALAECRWNAR